MLPLGLSLRIEDRTVSLSNCEFGNYSPPLLRSPGLHPGACVLNTIQQISHCIEMALDDYTEFFLKPEIIGADKVDWS